MDYPSTVSHDVTGDLVYGARPQLALALLLVNKTIVPRNKQYVWCLNIVADRPLKSNIVVFFFYT